jgi:hypothetical protein
MEAIESVLILLRNFPSPIWTMSHTCLIRAGLRITF